MIAKTKARKLTLYITLGVAPFLFLVWVALDPAMFAAASGWYGYNNTPVCPEPTSFTTPFHGLKERNNSVLASNGDVVQYLNGVLKYTADGISVPSPGFGYSHHVTFNNNHEGGTGSATDGNIDLPNGWNWHTGIFQLVDMGSRETRCVGLGTACTKYKDVYSSGTYSGQLGVDAKIIHNTTPKEMVLHGTNGTTATFYDFDSSHGGKFGALKKIVNAAGNDLTTEYYLASENTNLKDLLKTLTDTGEHTWVYTYIDSTMSNNNRRLVKVEVKDGSTPLAKSEYLYYDSSTGVFLSGSGTNGDLMRIVVTERDSNDLNWQRTSLFRYWTGTWSSSNKGAAHKLKYIIGPQSYKDLAAEVTDPLKATDTQLAARADYYLEYDTNGFVTKATIQGGGCSCGSAQGSYTYAYTPNGSWTTSSDFSVWKMSVTQTNPDGTARIVDVNGAGSIINDVLQQDADYQTGDQRWITHYKFDSYGRITEIHQPSSCASYTSNSVTLDTTGGGLVRIFTYDSSGNLTAQKLKNENASTTYWIAKTEYSSKALGSNTIYFPWKEHSFPEVSTDGTGGKIMQMDRTYHPDATDIDGDSNTTEDSLQVKELTLTPPDVPETENGDTDTLGETRKFYFNTLGQLQWEKDEVGSITYRAFHTSAGADLGLTVTEIIDFDTDGFSPPPPSGYTNSTGLSLRTAYTYQADGKRTEMLDPDDRTEKYHYSYLSPAPSTDAWRREFVVLTYPHVDTATLGPTTIRVMDHDGNVITTAKGDPDNHDSNLDDDLDETAATLEATFNGSLYERTQNVYTNGQLTEKLEWTNAESSTAEKYSTKYGYDSMGRLARVKDAEDTITRTYFTVNGRVRSRKLGTNDYLMGDALGESSGTNNMTKVEEVFYDGDETSSSAVGDGNITLRKRFVDDSASRDVVFTYDWRNRRLTGDGEEDFYEKLDYDNLDRVTLRYRYASSESSGNLRSQSETKFDVRGRVYRTIAYEVDSSGLGDDSLATDFWYNARGDQVKVRKPSGAFTKSTHDGAGRLLKSFVCYDIDETAYADADDVVGDIVVSQIQYDRDGTGSVILQTRWERKSTDTTSTSEHTSTSTAERYYLASWYDLLGRLVARADYGTNGGSDLTDYDPGTTGTQGYELGPPASSDSVLVTDYSFNLQGLLEDITDPAGHTTYQEHDNLGRLTKTIGKKVDGTPGSGEDDRKQEIGYNKVSQVTSRKVWMTSGSDLQETGYVFGVPKNTSAGDSKLASNNLLKTIKYPDPSSGSPSSSADDQESFAYNAQGEVIWKKDQIGNVHEYDFDQIGRRTDDRVTTVVTGVDFFILRIQAAYDALGRATKVTSHSAATGGDVRNEVELIYNGFGQVKESRQEHDEEVDGDTLKVLYNYSEPTSSEPISRLNSIQYPATNRSVYIHYDDPNGSGDYGKLDWILGRPSGVSNSSSISGTRVGDYTYQGLRRVVSRTASQAETAVTLSYSYDGSGRRQRILAQKGSTTFNDLVYAYNRDSQVVSREENEPGASAKDELYTFDYHHRLDVFKRGTLSGGSIQEPPARSQDWGLDLVGNWSSIATNGGVAVTREHDRSNEIPDVNSGDMADTTDFGGEDPSYDKNGNTTYVNLPAPANRTFVYDAWNRLVEGKLGDGGTRFQYFHYDGFGRRIRENEAGRDYYYSDGWQLLSERDGPTAATHKTLKEYVWGLQYMDEILARDEDKNSDGDTLDSADETLFYVQDTNWNVHTLCDESGSVVERCLYDPYGTPSFFDSSWGSRSSSTYSNVVLFTGRLWNSASYTYEYRNREYSSYLGRFLQRDPIGDLHSFGNKYSYVNSSPLTKLDPLGLCDLVEGDCFLCCACAETKFLDEVKRCLSEYQKCAGDMSGKAQMAVGVTLVGLGVEGAIHNQGLKLMEQKKELVFEKVGDKWVENEMINADVAGKMAAIWTILLQVYFLSDSVSSGINCESAKTNCLNRAESNCMSRKETCERINTYDFDIPKDFGISAEFRIFNVCICAINCSAAPYRTVYW